MAKRSSDEACLGTVLSYYKRTARQFKLKFQLSESTLQELVTAACFYCGDLPTQQATSSENKTDNSALSYGGIDFIDNSSGYTTKNCVPCCGRCSYAKQGLTMREFMDMVRQIAMHRKHKTKEALAEIVSLSEEYGLYDFDDCK